MAQNKPDLLLLDSPVVESTMEQSTSNLCALHNQTYTAFCFTDKQLICDSCAGSENHLQHDMKPESELRTQAVGKIEELKTFKAELDQFDRDLRRNYHDEEKALQSVLKEGFQKMREALSQREKALSSKVEQCLAQRKVVIEDTLKTNQIYKKKVLNRIKHLEEEQFEMDFIDNLDKSVSAISSLLDYTVLQNGEDKLVTPQNISNEIDQVIALINKPVDLGPACINSETFIEHLSDIYSGLNDQIKVFNAEKFIAFERESDRLVISLSSQAENRKLGITALKDVKEVMFDLSVIPTPEEWKTFKWSQIWLTLISLWPKLENAKTLTFHINANKFRADEFMKLIKAPFWNTQQVSVRFEIARAASSSPYNPNLVEILTNILPKVPNIRGIKLDLTANNAMVDEAIKALFLWNSSTIKDLDQFELDVSNSALTDEGLSVIASSMQHLKVLRLCLTETKITDVGLIKFSDNTLSTIKSLKNFEMLLWGNDITDNGALRLLENLGSVQSMKLSLSQTKITDKSLIAFKKMKLRHLQLYLSDTDISDDGLIKLLSNVKATRTLKLSFGKTKITDKSLKILAGRLEGVAGKLEHLVLDLNSTQVTDDGVGLLIQDMKRLKVLKLSLNNTNVTDGLLEVIEDKGMDLMGLLEKFEISLTGTKATSQGVKILARIPNDVVDFKVYFDNHLYTPNELQEANRPNRINSTILERLKTSFFG